MEYFGPEFEYSDWDYMLEVLERYDATRSGEIFYDGDTIYFRRMDEDSLVGVGVSFNDLLEVVSVSELKASIRQVIGVKLN